MTGNLLLPGYERNEQLCPPLVVLPHSLWETGAPSVDREIHYSMRDTPAKVILLLPVPIRSLLSQPEIEGQ